MRVLVTGAGGQLGAVVSAHFVASGHDVTSTTRRDLDVARHDDVLRIVSDVRPDAIVNCTADNRVDEIEADPSNALEVNGFAVRSLARAARDHGAVLVHYSTDFVFDGAPARREPYTEEDRPNPQSAYGQSKLLGEWFAGSAPRHYVFRVESLFGGPSARSSVDKIAEALRAGREVRVFEDRVVTPTHVGDIAAATEAALARALPFGLYHCASGGVTTFLEIGRELARLGGFDPARLVPVRMADLSLRAKRPLYCALSNARLVQAGVPLPTWQQALARFGSEGAASART